MLKYKKINFVGAQCTGKTSVFEALKEVEAFKDFNFYESLSRKLALEEGLKINEDGDSNTQKILFDKYSELLDKMLNEHAISNRCILDVASYTAFMFDHTDPADDDYENLSAEDFRERKEIVKRKADLELLVYFPIEFNIVKDGVRSKDPDFQKGVDLKIQQFLNNYKIPHIKVSGSIEQRVEQIKKAMGVE